MQRIAKATADQRATLIGRLIGRQVPRLWCPPLTHYSVDGSIDGRRMAAHWRHMISRGVGGFLVPGSTGDGWEMNAPEIAETLNRAIALTVELDSLLLVGALRPKVDEMQAVITATVARLQAGHQEADVLAVLRRHHIAGFTVCAPAGRGLTQTQIGAALARILDMELPIALYQLPQVTGNEVSPELFTELAARYPNLLLFKDTSGVDCVPLADRGATGVFMVRGAEGDYARWLEEAGGCYRGLLLSTANCFAGELRRIVELLMDGRTEQAEVLSRRLTEVVRAAFTAVANLEHGNAFANANKAIDHFMAYGSKALMVPPPLRHVGMRLPEEVIAEVGELLKAADFLPEVGYLSDAGPDATQSRI